MSDSGAEDAGGDARVGLVVTHRRYVSYDHAHYAGHLVDGAYSLGLFGDVATEVCIRTDGDEGLFASYTDVQFREAVRAGDLLEVTAEVVETLGSDTLVFFRIADTEAVARVPPGYVRGAGEAVTLYPDLARMHLFDPATERAI